jgi:peptide/nickel transport system substrate-binding protein
MAENYWSSVLNARLHRRRGLAMTGALAVGGALLAACGGGEEGGGSDKSSLVSQPADTSKQAKRGGILKDFARTDTPTVDFSTPIAAGGANNCYACFMRVVPGYLKPTTNELEPDMAESWERSPDGLQITLKLRQGIKFHNKPPVNGRALDMEDVLFSWKRFADKASNRVSVVNAVNPGAPVLSLIATDSRTIAIKLSEPVSYALELFAPYTGGGNMVMLPKETDTTFDIRTDVIGTHAYLMSDYKPSVAFTFKRHPEYYDQDYTLVDQREAPIITEYAAQLAHFKAGNIHFFDGIRGEDVLTVKREVPPLLIYPLLQIYANVLTFGVLPEGKSPFLDERVRQAFSMSWDRDLWIEAFHNVSKFESEGLPVETRWNSHIAANWDGWWVDPKGKEFGPNAKYFQHDIPEAKKLLAAAGYPNGFSSISHSPQSGPYGANAPRNLVEDNMTADIGITYKIDDPDYATDYIPNYRDGHGQYEGWAWHSLSGANPDTLSPVRSLASQFWPKGGAGFHGFSTSSKNDQAGDPSLSALIEKARLELDTEKLRALVFDIQRYLGKAMWALQHSGAATGFTVAWPALGNFRVWQGGQRPLYGLWLDETKPPFKGT